MNLIDTKQHIIDSCKGEPEIMQQVALTVIDEKIKEQFVRNWASNNKEDVIKFNHINKDFGGINKLYDSIQIIKKHAKIIRQYKRQNKSVENTLNALLNKIDRL